jgi:hypothetical protein
MKKVVFTIILFMSVRLISFAQEVSVPYHVKQFLEEFGYSLDEFLSAEELSRNFSFDNYFLNTEDTLFWPDNFNLEDKYFKHRLGPKELYQKFGSFKNMSSLNFTYALRELGAIRVIRSKSMRYYDKFRVTSTDNHIFNSSEFGGADSTVSFTNYYDIISWFNPRTYQYEFRINKIYENQTKSWLAPQTWQISLDYLSPAFKNNAEILTRSVGYGFGLKAYWLLGGKNTLNYSLKSGLELSSLLFKTKNSDFVFYDNSLIDKDGYPFTLKAVLKDFNQNLSFQMITLPIHFQLSKYFLNGKYMAGLYGGVNLSLPVNVKSGNKEGEVTYSGKYKFDYYSDSFDFPNDSITLEDLKSYNFTTFKYNDLKDPTPKLSSFLFSAEIGGEFNWYLGKRIAANIHLSYVKSLNPIYKNHNQTLAYNIKSVENGNTFEPSLNSFLALGESNNLDLFKIGFGINYIIEKPVIPHGRVGYGNGEIKKIVKNDLVLSAGSFSQNSKQKELNIFVSGVSTGPFGARISYRYVGPSTKFFQQGRLSSGSRSGNQLKFQVPESNTGAKLYLEEPYGYNLKMEDTQSTTGGLYNEIKVLDCNDIWAGNDTKRNLNISFDKLNKLNIFLVNYKYSFDDLGAHRDKIISLLKNAVSQAISDKESCVIYIVSDQPEAYVMDSGDQFAEIFEKIEIKLQDTDDVTANIEGLQNFLNTRFINPRRNINLTLFTTEEFLDQGLAAILAFPRVLKIDQNYLNYLTYLHSYNTGMKSGDYDKSFNYLKKIGKINN